MIDVFGFVLDSAWVWFAIGLGLLFLELSTGTFFLLWPGVAAFVFALVTWLVPGLSTVTQIFGFAIVAVALTLLGRSYFKLKPANIGSDRPLLNRRGAQLAGRRVQAVSAFENGQGYVKLDDTQWFARTDEAFAITQGASLKVVRVDGSTLIVEPA